MTSISTIGFLTSQYQSQLVEYKIIVHGSQVIQQSTNYNLIIFDSWSFFTQLDIILNPEISSSIFR